MKILVYQWKAYSSCFLYHHLQVLGHEVKLWKDDVIIDATGNSIAALEKELNKGYDIVFSYNYFCDIAIAANHAQVPYFAWTQDSPLLALYDASTYLETNYFFCFDYEQYTGMQKRGIKNAFYCPLAADVKTLQAVAANCIQKDIDKYTSETSFVGSLYSDRNQLFQLEAFPNYLKGYLGAIMEAQMRLPDIQFSRLQIPKDVMEILHKVINFVETENSQLCYEELLENLIDRQVTVMERRRMIQLLSQKTDFKLYTSSDTSEYSDVKNCGTVDYYTEMPKVFRLSKININATLRSIRAGIPLRILDVLASGGFLITNAQPELECFFEEGKSIVTFRNLEEMDDKVAYYLKHETERKNITENGMKIVEKAFDFSVRLPEMFRMAGIK